MSKLGVCCLGIILFPFVPIIAVLMIVASLLMKD